MVRSLHGYRRGLGSNPGKPDFFFRLFLSAPAKVSCHFICEDLHYIYLEGESVDRLIKSFMEQQTKLQDSITVYENIKGNYDVRKNACSESELMNRFRYLG